MTTTISSRRPPALRDGSVAAVFSPSSETTLRFPARTLAGMKRLSAQLHVAVRGEQRVEAFGYRADRPSALCRQLEGLFRDPDVALIVCAIGGMNSNSLLDHVDWEVLRAHPTLICGYSDSTALLLAIHAMTQQVVLHGPALLPQWGDPKGPLPETIRSFRAAVCGDLESWEPVCNAWWVSPRTRWEDPEASFHANPKVAAVSRILRPGIGRGRVLGGNLETINMIIGTPYAPNFAGGVLFVEATGEEAYLPRLHRALVHLRHAGVFEQIVGLVVGRCPDSAEVGGVTLEDVIGEVTSGFTFPIVVDVDVGHTEPIPTLPIGCDSVLQALDEPARWTILERAVEPRETTNN